MGSITRSFANNILAAGKFDGTKLTGDIPEANLSANAPAFDDNKIVNDLSTLGLRVHTQENLSASNTNSQYVDVFQDDSGFTNISNVTRSASEYIGSISTASATDVTLLDTNHSDSLMTNTTADSNSYIANAMYVAPYTKITIKTAHFYTHNTGGSQGGRFYFTSNSSGSLGTNPSAVDSNNRKDWSYSSESAGTLKGGTFGNTQIFNNLSGSSNLKFWAVIGGLTQGFGGAYARGKGSGDTTQYNYWNPSGNNTATYMGASVNDFITSNVTGQIASDEVMAVKVLGDYEKVVANATGSSTCPAITAASSTTKMGAVITYQDNAGTNALNTDIVLQLSADNGSNFSTATLTALPDFSSGIKMAKVNDLAVTAGTQLKYKILFANQAVGSKEARIRGVSLNY